jgi:hypothetical protein
VDIQNLALDYGEYVDVSQGSFAGRIDGPNLELGGAMLVNGLEVPLTLKFAALPEPRWEASSISAGLELENLRARGQTLGLEGTADVKVHLAGAGSQYQGRLEIAGDWIGYKGLGFEDLRVTADADPRGLTIQEGAARVFNGRMKFGGGIYPLPRRTGFWADYERRWTMKRGEGATARDTLALRLMGHFQREPARWTGDGSGEVRDGGNRILARGKMQLGERGFEMNFAPASGDGYVSARFVPGDTSGGLSVNAHNPQAILQTVLGWKSAPEALSLYDVNLNLRGGLDEATVYLDWQGRGLDLGGSLSGHLRRHVGGAATCDGTLDLRHGRDRRLAGAVSAEYAPGILRVQHLWLRLPSGRELLRGSAEE